MKLFGIISKILNTTSYKFYLHESILKKFLYEKSSLEISSLPYNEINSYTIYIVQNGRVALVTGSRKTAEDISKHLNLFDEVYGSSSNKNLVRHKTK